MTFEIMQGDPATIVVAGEAMGGPDGLAFSSALSELLAGGTRNVVVDLADVTLMNSSGLGTLIAASRSMSAVDGRIVICGARDHLLKLLEMTRLDAVLEHHPTREEALEALSRD